MRGEDWKKYIQQEHDKELLEEVRWESCVGRPAEKEGLLKRLGNRFQCKLIRGTAGRVVKKPKQVNWTFVILSDLRKGIYHLAGYFIKVLLFIDMPENRKFLDKSA